MLDVQRPILVIGAGRSGSTLIARMLDQHDELRFVSENSFLVPRLWLELWEDRYWFNGERFMESNPAWALDGYPDVDQAVLREEMKRVGRVIADTVSVLLGIDAGAWKAWGYKEIWNGSAQFHYDWVPYDFVFPAAVWVHLVRNPFDFAKSCAHWNRDALTLEYLVERLRDWKSIVECSRERKSTGRFIEIRYEDLISEPERVLTPVLNHSGLSWSESCKDALGTYRLKSHENERFYDQEQRSPQEINAAVESVAGVKTLAEDLGYRLPEGFERVIVSKNSSRERAGFEQLNLVPRSFDLRQAHKPQHLLKHELRLIEATCGRLKEERDYHQREHEHYFNETLVKKLRRELALGHKLRRFLGSDPERRSNQ